MTSDSSVPSSAAAYMAAEAPALGAASPSASACPSSAIAAPTASSAAVASRAGPSAAVMPAALPCDSAPCFQTGARRCFFLQP